MRVTDSHTLSVAREVFNETNDLLCSSIPNSVGLKSGIFKSNLLDYSTWKHVGEVQNVETSSISSILSQGSVPIITCMGETFDGSEFLNINADVAAVQMSRHLSDVGKLIFVSAAGGLKDEEGVIIDSIDLSSEYDRYMGMDWVKYGTWCSSAKRENVTL